MIRKCVLAMNEAMKVDRENFTCKMCGECCRIKDGIVRVNNVEISRIAAFLGMSEGDFIEKETEVSPDRKSLILGTTANCRRTGLHGSVRLQSQQF